MSISPPKNRRWWVMLNISIGVYMSTLDASVVNLSLPTIIQSLNTDLKMVAWVITAYLIVIIGCLLLVGRLGDLLGQRKVYLSGFLIFTVGSALCGFSPTIHFLVFSRALQGLGASTLMVIGTAIVATAFPEKERGQAMGMIGAVVSAGFLTGPILGGFLVEHLGWRSVFFINLPIGALGIILSSRALEADKPMRGVRLDLRGAFLLFVFVTSLLFFLNRGGRAWLFLCLVSFGLFVLVEYRSSSPLVELSLFRRHLFISSLGASFFSFWMAAAHSFVVPFFLQNILRFSPSKVGMMIFPVSLTVMLSAPLGGRFSDRVGVRIPTAIGLALISLTIFSFSFLKSDASVYEIIARQIIIGIGIGLFNPANNSAIIGSLPQEKVGLASSFLALSRNLGMVIGVAFAEMVIAFRLPKGQVGAERGIPSLESIQDVWRLVFFLGLIALLISWVRGWRRDE
ncbi:MAG: MFS transporter [Thermodesulfobacteriota bacterium]